MKSSVWVVPATSLSTDADTTFMAKSAALHRETLAQIPRAIKTIGALVIEPQQNLGRAMWSTGRIMSTVDSKERWHTVEAAIITAQTLRETLTELLGTSFTVTPPVELTATLPANAAAGAEAACRMIHAKDSAEVESWREAAYAERVDPQALLGAYLMACLIAQQCIVVLAQGTGMTQAQAWKKARPLLLP
jgi:hypothetical protein